MNTIERFNIVETKDLEGLYGGKVNWGKVGSCAAGIAFGAGEGYIATAGGTAFLGPYAVGTGAIGAVVGGIGGAMTC